MKLLNKLLTVTEPRIFSKSFNTFAEVYMVFTFFEMPSEKAKGVIHEGPGGLSMRIL
jgi:hypothetical protein